jgi:hypothetical protein
MTQSGYKRDGKPAECHRRLCLLINGPPAVLRDPHASNFDHPSAGNYALGLCDCEPCVDRAAARIILQQAAPPRHTACASSRYAAA